MLLFLTFLTTTYVGIGFAINHDAALVSGATDRRALIALVLAGFQYSLPLLAILLSHEMGHYLMCRRYGVEASPPYFIPLWLWVPWVGLITGLGTFGAFIRIREPMREKRHVFDIGIAGPIAGFVV
ncbi:MAG TPA: site-2 protease family protein, partial [Thermoanaerobaculia bacterium]|nr:site-2 protease family protein [Thermoanaerobaculia bacterium]